MPRIFISIGSNVDAERNIRSSIRQLRAALGELTCSPVYRNPAEGFVGDDFYNLVVGCETVSEIPAICAQLREIEHAHGRHRGEAKFAPRTLDLDLLTYGDVVLATPTLNLPRADILKYEFVLRPLADIAPDARHPVTHETYRALWQSHARRAGGLKWVPDFFSNSD